MIITKYGQGPDHLFGDTAVEIASTGQAIEFEKFSIWNCSWRLLNNVWQISKTKRSILNNCFKGVSILDIAKPFFSGGWQAS